MKRVESRIHRRVETSKGGERGDKRGKESKNGRKEKGVMDRNKGSGAGDEESRGLRKGMEEKGRQKVGRQKMGGEATRRERGNTRDG